MCSRRTDQDRRYSAARRAGAWTGTEIHGDKRGRSSTPYTADGPASQSVSRGCVPIRAISNPVCEACVVLECHCLSGCAASGRFLLNAASPRDEKQPRCSDHQEYEQTEHRFLLNAASPRDEKQPRCSDHQEYEQTEHRGQQSKSVELTLSEVVTPDEDDVLAPALRGDCREVAAGKE